jgi:hypothetical protein
VCPNADRRQHASGACLTDTNSSAPLTAWIASPPLARPCPFRSASPPAQSTLVWRASVHQDNDQLAPSSRRTRPTGLSIAVHGGSPARMQHEQSFCMYYQFRPLWALVGGDAGARCDRATHILIDERLFCSAFPPLSLSRLSRVRVRVRGGRARSTTRGQRDYSKTVCVRIYMRQVGPAQGHAETRH